MRHGPDYIQFYPTLRCNRSCDFCFHRFLPAMSDMTVEDYLMLLNTLSSLSVKTLDIIGGEPTLHADIVRFVREAKHRGLQVNISSNGMNIEMLENIRRVSSAVTVGISINDRDIFNHLKKAVQKNDMLVKTVYGSNSDPTLINDILQLHPRKFYLLYRDIMVSDELDRAVPFFHFMSNTQQTFYAASNINAMYCSGFLPDTAQYPELDAVRCPAGTTKLGVLPDGSVYPCNLFFGKQEYLLGNILTDSFDTIWNHPALNFFRAFTGNRCPRKSCDLHARCHGGCPAHAFSLAGDIAAPDPRCMGG